PLRRPAPGQGRSAPPMRTRVRGNGWDGREKMWAGGDVLSHPVSRAVPSALRGLTAVFGMGTGVAPAPWPPASTSSLQKATRALVEWDPWCPCRGAERLLLWKRVSEGLSHPSVCPPLGREEEEGGRPSHTGD